jgi:hypothetical protein
VCKFTVADVLELEQNQLSKLTLTSWHARTLHAIRRCKNKQWADTLISVIVVINCILVTTAVGIDIALHAKVTSAKNGLMHAEMNF